MSDMITTELGMQVPAKEGEDYRVHTSGNWQRTDPESYDYCIHLIRDLGIVNRSELVRLVDGHRAERGVRGVSRNSVTSLINDPTVFKPGEINEIIARTSALLTMESIGAARELVERAKSTKDLGAVAMTLTSAHNVKQLSSGGPTEIKETRHRFSVADFERLKEETRGKIIEAEVVTPAAETALL